MQQWVVIGDGYEPSSAYSELFLSMQQMRILILLIIVLLDVVHVLCVRAGLAKPEAKMTTRRFGLYYVWRSAVVAHLA